MVIAFFLVLSIVAAEASVTESVFVWPSNNPIEYLKPNVATTAYLRFSYTGEDVVSIGIDLADANKQQEIDALRIDPLGGGCAIGETIDCQTGHIVLYTDESSIAVIYTFTYADGSTSTETKNYDFIIDGTSPQVMSITTQSCDDDTCYINDGLNTIAIVMQDDTATFNRKNVGLLIGGDAYYADACEGMTCTINALLACDDGQRLRVAIASTSKDDAGNSLQGDIDTIFTCDATAPVMASEPVFTVSSGLATTVDGRANPFIAIGEAVTMTFSVQDDSSQVAASLDLAAFEQDVITHDCDKGEDGLFTCSLSFSPTLESPQANIVLPLTITDFAGNEVQEDLVIDVVEQSDTESNDWTAKTPSMLYANKHYLNYASKDVFLTVSLSKNAHVASAYLLSASGVSCEPTSDGSAPDLLEMDVLSYAGTSVFLKGTLQSSGTSKDAYGDYSQLKYTCTMSLQTLRGEYLGMPEEESFAVTFKLHESETIGEKVTEEIAYEKNKSLKMVDEVIIAKKLVSGAQLVCSAPGILKSVGGSLSGASAAMQLYPPLQSAAETLHESGKKLQDTAEKKLYQNVLSTPCSMLTCENNLVEKAYGDMLNLDDTEVGSSLSKVGETLDAAGFNTSKSMFNPYESWLASVMTMCLPAMITHVDNYMAIKCDYLACLADDVGNAKTTIDQCQQRRDYGTCIFIKGGLINAVPFYSAFKDLSASLLDVFRDPISMFTTAGIVAPCLIARSGGPVADKICYTTSGIAGSIASAKRLQTMYQQTKSLFSGGGAASTVCESLELIDSETLYWEYGDQYEKENFDLSQYAKTGSDYSFNAFTGYTTTIAGDDGKETTVSIMPQMEGDPIIYVDGKRAFSADILDTNDVELFVGDASVVIDSAHVELAQELADETIFDIDNAEKSKYLQWYKTFSENAQQWQGDLAAAERQIEQSKSYLSALRNYDDAYEYVVSGYIDESEALNAQLEDLGLARYSGSIDISKLSTTQRDYFLMIAEDGTPSARRLAKTILSAADDTYGDYLSVVETVGAIEAIDADGNPISLEYNADGSLTDESIERLKDSEDGKRDAAKAEKRRTEQDLGGEENVAQAAARYVDENWQGVSWIGSTFAATNLASNVLHTIKSDPEDIGWGKDNNQIEFIERWYDALTAPAGSNMCQNKVRKSTDEYMPFTYDAATSSTANGAFVAALREDNGEGKYSYLISAFFVNRNDELEENLSFSISLRSSSRSEDVVLGTDDDGNELTKLSVGQNEVKSWSGADFLRAPYDDEEYTNRQYDEVCIEFHNTRLERWFSALGNSGQREFCREVEFG